MLQEMGVTVWAPSPTAQPVPQPSLRSETAPAADVAPALAPERTAPARPLLPATAARPAPAPEGSTGPAGGPSAAPLAAAPLRLHAPQVLYPLADPAQTPAELGAGWLIVAECLTPAEPLGGDAGRLLDNMLRAMQLHRHPRVHLAALERIAPAPVSTPASQPAPAPEPAQALAQDIPAALAGIVATLRPALVLVLGHVAARAALGRTEPLGRLRAGPHQLAGTPAVVTYDPAFLLRSQDTKAAAWADLCRALAIVRAPAE